MNLGGASDEWNAATEQSFPATTYVFDVADPENPAYRGSFATPAPMAHADFSVAGAHLFEANYRGGLRIFHVDSAGAGNEVGSFETFPEFPRPWGLTGPPWWLAYPEQNLYTNGALASDPSLPSGRVLVVDSRRGLFVLDPTAAVISLAEISPPLGAGGESFTLTGAGFKPGATVSFGGLAATSVVVVDSRTITGEVPVGFTGPVDILIQNTDGSQVLVEDAFAPPGPCDVNFDEVVDVRDVLLASRVLSGNASFSPAAHARADVAPAGGADGALDAGDLVVIQQGSQGIGACAGP